jgi:hypothetical protein
VSYSEIYSVLSVLSGRARAKLEEFVRPTIDYAARAALATHEITERFRTGLKSAKWSQIVELLTRYYDTEKLFGEGGSIEERVLKLREENKDDLGRVSLVLSHTRAQGKNKLILAVASYH